MSESSELMKIRKAIRIVRELLSWFSCLLFALIAALILRSYVYELVFVDGPSMEPTLYTGEYVFIEKLSVRFGKIERGEILIVKFPDSENNYIKRAVGLPGERVSVHGGVLYINGEALSESYINEYPIDYEMVEIFLGEDQYFVLGDNRNNSTDSHIVGPIEKSKIVGHAQFVAWPFSEIKGLK